MSNEPEDERTTADLLVVLDEDYRRCYEQILLRLDEGERNEDGTVYADHEFDARQLIRTAFAYIEGATFVLKIEASFRAEERGFDLTPQQQHFIFEADFDINDKGEVVERAAKISLTKNIRFAFAVFSQASGIKNTLDVSLDWWGKLQGAIKVRDRLTHPRFPADLDVSPQEVIATIAAKVGFDEALHALIEAGKA
ncbi:hypothetical protein [Halomonas sp. H5]|uniref:hypothetical protein n=1 Tax=Halomonas sp. H5 TaxID=3423910 RepID=UPI003D35B374